MRPVREGDRGPAVEDIQRRLLALDHDLGPTGVDGVFLGMTVAAVREFQCSAEIAEDGVVGPQTWAALVDATFSLGDRLLYLRFPHLHGRDVTALQTVLRTLGFGCGEADGIFGAYTETAVREFQLNVGLPSDGIVGGETVKAVAGLRHVWEGKEHAPVVSGKRGPARAAHTLSGKRVVVRWLDAVGQDVAERLANLATAAEPDADIEALPDPVRTTGRADLVLTVGSADPVTAEDRRGVPVVVVPPRQDPSLAARVVTAIEARREGDESVVVELRCADAHDERWTQAVAVGLFDGLCAGVA